MVIVPQETVLDPVRFGQLLLDEGVTTMFMTIGCFTSMRMYWPSH